VLAGRQSRAGRAEQAGGEDKAVRQAGQRRQAVKQGRECRQAGRQSM
jgi:hypothetical protein